MPKYCLDTSGLSNPILDLPEDIFPSLWGKIIQRINSGALCWNGEISKELESIFGAVGDALKSAKASCCFEVGDDIWQWQKYLEIVEILRVKYQPFISEYNGGRKDTVGLNDISIVALAKTLELPLISMEKDNLYNPSEKRKRIPEVCRAEGVKHLTFNEFLRAEGITL